MALTGCRNSEEKAEDYYQSGLTLLAAGDADRALVEFRNVLKYDGFHKDARQTYANVQFDRGEIGEAYAQYLRLIEQYPDTVEVRQRLAEIAIALNDWAEAERHGKAALILTPRAPGVQAIGAALDYHQAQIDSDTETAAKAVVEARRISKLLPDNMIARGVMINDLLSKPDVLGALAEIEQALQIQPDSLDLLVLKLRLLVQADDSGATGTLLKEMVERFPVNQDVRDTLIRWYVKQKDFEGAEVFLRQLAGDDTAAPEGHAAVVQLLQSAKGSDAAITELERLIAANDGTPNGDLYVAMKATINFSSGSQSDAIAEIEKILAEAAPSDGTRGIKMALAQMLLATGNQVDARARLEEVLAEDSTNTEALKMRAGFLIREDKPAQAITDLRTALSQNPRDPATLTLMAEAHERDGNPDLAGERLALAVEVSGNRAEESLRYARFLLRKGLDSVTEALLVDARSVSPGNIEILKLLGDLSLRKQGWIQAQNIADSLRKIDQPEARTSALSLQAAILQGQNRTEESLALLDGAIGQGSNARVLAQIMQTQVRSGKVAEARKTLDAELAQNPDDSGLQMLSAGLNALMGQSAESDAIFRKVIADNPQMENPVRLLYGQLLSAGRAADATTLLKNALERMSKSTQLRWLRASELERDADFDGAIAIYEALYSEDSSNIVIANNLASMISTHSTDIASLDRATAVARRLRDSDVPAYQDTYGWIEYRRGNLNNALKYLEPAAVGLPNDPLTQYHLDMTYFGLEQTDKARTSLQRALDIAGDSSLIQFDETRKILAELMQAPQPEGTDTNP